MNEYQLLHKIKSPEALRTLPKEALPLLCQELRQEITARTLENGGHLASNLGVVELTVAWHRVFHSPSDRLIFDVGHQSYVHKLLTGRQEEFSTLREPGGLSGFPKRSESEHDPFGAGHSGTSLSAALGFAEADRLSSPAGTNQSGGQAKRYTTAVVGDGAFTCGMIHEAINNCRKDLRLIIILNENEMSISPNTGAFAGYLAKIRTSGHYYRAKKRTESILSKVPLLGKPLIHLIRGTKKRFKNLLYSSNMFEGMGIYYFGPVDGHDLPRLEAILEEAKAYDGCCLVHVKTKKGKGYEPAEKEPNRFHGVPPAGRASGENFSARCGQLLCGEAEKDPSLCAITAAMAEGTGLIEFKRRYPNRFFDVGIAESHAATFAAGLSAAGMKPVFAVYSTFLQRSYDNLLHDLALQNLPALVCIDRAGLAAADGPTHHGIFDVAFCSQIPGAEIYAPLDYGALERYLKAGLDGSALSFVRYPSGMENPSLSAALPYCAGNADAKEKKVGFLRGNLQGTSPRAFVITYGRIASEALTAVETLRAEGTELHLLVLEKLKPYGDTAKALLPYLSAGSGSAPILFLEEGIKAGGAGMMLHEALRHLPGLENRPFEILAIDESFGIQTKNESIYATCGIDSVSVAAAVKKLLS